MLTEPTIEKLCAMRLRGMAEAFAQQQQDANIHSLSFEERLGLLIDRQWNWRQNRALDRRLRNGRLQGPACIEDIDYRAPRGLDRQLVRSLTAESAWVRESAATVTPRSSSKPRNCFATSLKRGPMAAMVS
jgi:hypothetical protein